MKFYRKLALESLQGLIRNIGLARLAAIAGMVIAILSFFIYLIIRASAPEMSLLFTELDPADGGKIIEKLKSTDIPIEVKGDGSQIYVPKDQVAKLRMELAQDGLPAGGTIGYEIFDKSDMLGTTSAMLDINQLRALEGELSKSIRTIQGVASARVHLVLPKRELFSQEKQEPAASIILKMRGTSRLSATQVQAIQHLTASAVAGLTVDKISIIDDKGNLLAKGRESIETTDAFSTQQDVRQNYENRLARTVESLLEKSLGLGKIRAEVSIEMDFDKVTSTSVEFNPDGQVARSSVTSEEGSAANESSGTGTVSIQNALPDNSAQPSGTALQNDKATKTEENITYEISNTTKTYVKESGVIKRLSVAVLVDGVYNKGADGKQSYAPRPSAELEQLTSLVKTAVGFKEDRGDTVKVVNLQFMEPDDPSVPVEPFKWLSYLDVSRILQLGFLGILGLVVIFGIFRPLFKQILNRNFGAVKYQQRSNNNYSIPAPVEYPQSHETSIAAPAPLPYEPEAVLEPYINIDSIEDRVKGSSAKKIREVIDKHPEEAAAIIRSWIYADR